MFDEQPHETFWQSFLSTVSGKSLSDRQKLYMNFCLMVTLLSLAAGFMAHLVRSLR
jgi:hypothetical protein